MGGVLVCQEATENNSSARSEPKSAGSAITTGIGAPSGALGRLSRFAWPLRSSILGGSGWRRAEPAAGVVEEISGIPDIETIPTSVPQARVLLQLKEPEKRREAWKQVVDAARKSLLHAQPDNSPTGAHFPTASSSASGSIFRETGQPAVHGLVLA